MCKMTKFEIIVQTHENTFQQEVLFMMNNWCHYSKSPLNFENILIQINSYYFLCKVLFIVFSFQI